MAEKVTAADAGCLVDNVRGIHMPSMIIGIAEGFGYDISEELRQYLKENEDLNLENHDETIDTWEFVNEEVQDVEAWMNDHVAPPGYYFGTHPDLGDWGLYSTLLGVETVSDLQGLTVAFSDLEDWLQEEMKNSKAEEPVVYTYKRRDYYLLTADAVNNIPAVVDIGEVDWTGDDYRPETVTIRINEWKPNAEFVGRKASTPNGFDVYLQGKKVDHVYWDDSQSVESVRRELVNEMGYNPKIKIERSSRYIRRYIPRLKNAGEFHVYLREKQLESHYYEKGTSESEVKNKLIAMGLDPSISVRASPYENIAGRRIQEMFSNWEISLRGKALGTVKVYEESGQSYTAEQVKAGLVKEEHYDPAIVVTRMTKTAGRQLVGRRLRTDITLDQYLERIVQGVRSESAGVQTRMNLRSYSGQTGAFTFVRDLAESFKDFPENQWDAGIRKSWQIALQLYGGAVPINQSTWEDEIRKVIYHGAVGRAITKIEKARMYETEQRPVDVYLNGKLIDTVWYDITFTLDGVRRDLIGHDGYDPQIVVAWGR